MSMENSNDTFGNRAVPQPTALRRAPIIEVYRQYRQQPVTPQLIHVHWSASGRDSRRMDLKLKKKEACLTNNKKRMTWYFLEHAE